jgi:hypothetical protein
MRRAGHVTRMGRRVTHMGFWWESQNEKRSSRRRRRWAANVEVNVGEIGWDGLDLMHLAQDRSQWRALVNTVMNLRVP